MSIPDGFETFLVSFAGDTNAAQVLSGLKGHRNCVFRCNPLCGDPERTLDMLRVSDVRFQPVAGFDNLFYCDDASRTLLLQHESWESGAVYIQNASSVLAALLLNPEPGEHILDLTAAPGSKTQLMAVMMNNTGSIAAVEIQRDRFFRMKANLQKNGVRNTRFFHKDGTIVGRQKPGAFDKVLLDAPCSSESLFGEDGNPATAGWTLKKIKATVQKQKMLVNSAIQALKPGGRLVYATCTINPYENEEMDMYIRNRMEEQISTEPLPEWVLRNVPVYKLPQYTEPAMHMLRIMPGQQWDAFFIAVYRKKD